MAARHLLPLALLCAAAKAALWMPLPSYITPCSRNDPDVSGCALKSGRAAMKDFINGDRQYRIPSLNPLRIDTLAVDEGSGPLGLAFVANNGTVYGLADTSIDDVRIDLKNQHVEYDLTMPRLELLCIYNVSGKVLLLPIVGNGPGNITLIGVKIRYIYDFGFESRTRDGETKSFAIPKNSKLEYNVTRAYIHLDNLFNGDKLLGETTNRVLNENWQDLAKEVGPTIAEAIGEVMRQILQNIFDVVSYEDAFPDKV
ncbi:protein takeout-like [Schistocerca cancellata]|uniref:protein takeout-like n=1 Tax=Schistocerca cancellata TaxID=274614 RepID=UPI00211938E3|nr:protein takeout-like [Schistocerca cancellata]